MSVKHKQRAKNNKNWYNAFMKSEKPLPSDYNQPVAYDAEGRPLYAHPPAVEEVQSKPNQRVVHVARPAEPEKPFISDATRLKHNQSEQAYPGLNLSDGEYVISAVRRHPIGLVVPLAVGVLLVSFSLTLLFYFNSGIEYLRLSDNKAGTFTFILLIVAFASSVVLFMYISYFIYTNNKFFLTNESVIQEIQTGLFSKHEQTVSLSNIEDASYVQQGIIQQIFNYGSIRLSTEGDETTYRFSYVANPKQHIAVLNNAVEAFLNGRPVDS
jgi:hypothetical protein